MKQIMNSVKSFFEIAFDIHHNHTASILLIESLQEIEKELRKAKDEKKVIGIHCPALGSGIILIKVEDLVEKRVLLRLFDVEGNIQDIIEIEMETVSGVTPFNTRFAPAVMKKKHSVVYS